jgi:hypothetical protein
LSSALTVVGLVAAVGRGVPLIRTTDVFTNPVPFTVIDVAADPAATATGLSEITPGTGLLMGNEYGFELPPPGDGLAGFTTVSCNVPAVLTAVAGNVACRNVELMKPVASAVFPKFTTDNETKFFPLIFSVTDPLPAVAEAGDVVMIWGVGLAVGLITNVNAAVVPPPGDGVVTVILAVPGFWISPAGTCAVSVFIFTKSAVSGMLFQSTVEEGVKLYPVTVSVKVG